MKITITTFNLENLFNRYAFLDTPWNQQNYEKLVQALGVVSIASRRGDLVAEPITQIQRNNTAQAILDSSPDILAVQEVENLYTLRIFNDSYLDDYFDKLILIDGNDPRGIDVGLMVKKGSPVEIINVRTHMDEATDGGSVRRSSILSQGYLTEGALFSRDCLEVDCLVNGKILTLLVNHFKAQDANDSSIKKRTNQANKVKDLVNKAVGEGKYPIVLGDLNVDQNHPRTPGDLSINSLLTSPELKDPFPADTWTHYFVPQRTVSRLDYILPHKSLNVDSINIVRKGLTTKCRQYEGPRYATVGAEHTEASDHCPISITLDLS